MPHLGNERTRLIYATVLRPWLLSDVENTPEGAIGPVSGIGLAQGAGSVSGVGFQTGSEGLATGSSTASAASLVLETETTAWIDAVETAGGSVSSARQIIVNDLIIGLKADSLWSKLDRLWIFAAENEESAFIDLKALDEATNVSATFTADQGYTGGGIFSGYVNTGFNPNTDGSQYTQNSASIFGWNRTGRSGANVGLVGCTAINTVASIIPYNTSTQAQMAANNSTYDTYFQFSLASSGFFHVTRTASTVSAAYRNGSSLGTSSALSTTPPNQDFYACAINTSGAPQSISTDEIACVGMGAGMNSTEAEDLYTRISDYMTAVGA